MRLWAFFDRDQPERHADIREHFRCGSIGAEERAGVPDEIWAVLPDVFPQYLPDRPGRRYERFGFLYESASHKRPIGTSFRERRIGLVGLNCAVCHTGSIRDSEEGPRRIILGIPAHQFDFQSYFRFAAACGRDPRFNAATLLPAIRKADPGFSWFDRRPPQGPGRVDTFNPYKVIFRFDMTQDDTVGSADLSAAVSPENPRGNVAPLGRQQRQGRGAQQERGDRASAPRSTFRRALAEQMNTLGTGRPWKFSRFRKTNGYANMPIDGVWLRAPYLHNGSVPTLRDLLNPPEQGPAVFYRGYYV